MILENLGWSPARFVTINLRKQQKKGSRRGSRGSGGKATLLCFVRFLREATQSSARTGRALGGWDADEGRRSRPPARGVWDGWMADWERRRFSALLSAGSPSLPHPARRGPSPVWRTMLPYPLSSPGHGGGSSPTGSPARLCTSARVLSNNSLHSAAVAAIRASTSAYTSGVGSRRTRPPGR
jgi:hypothetical protein